MEYLSFNLELLIRRITETRIERPTKKDITAVMSIYLPPALFAMF